MIRVLYWLVLVAWAALDVLATEIRTADLSHHEEPIALCPNHHEIRVHPTPWQRDHGRQVRVITSPPCEVVTPTRTTPQPVTPVEDTTNG